LISRGKNSQYKGEEKNTRKKIRGKEKHSLGKAATLLMGKAEKGWQEKKHTILKGKGGETEDWEIGGEKKKEAHGNPSKNPISAVVEEEGQA